MKVLLLAIGIVGISFVALGIRIFFVKDGKFPETEVGKNKRMRELGIYCTKCEEHRVYREAQRKKKAKINPAKLSIDFEGLSC